MLEQQHSETVKTGVAQCQTILGFVHAKAARTAGAGGKEYVAVNNLLLGHALLFKALQVLDHIAHGEVGGIALAVVAEFFAELESVHIGRGNHFGLIAQAFQRAVYQLLVLPRQATEKQRGLAALFLGEHLLLRLLEVVNFLLNHSGFFFKPGPLFGQALLDDQLDRVISRRPDLDQATHGRFRLRLRAHL